MTGTNITQEVRNYLAKDLSIQKGLQKNLINIRALAKHIIREQNLKSSTDAVISAIRRFPCNEGFHKESETVKDIFKFSNVSTKSGIACITLRKQSDIQKYLSEVANLTDFEKRETLRMIKGKNNLKIITEMASLPKIKGIFSGEEGIEVKENLSEIRILTLDVKADKTKGVAARISNELLINDINISEIVFCVPEIIIYVEQKDLLNAYKSILSLC